MVELGYYRSLLNDVAALPESELWRAQGLEDELKPFWNAVRAAWEAKLIEALAYQSEQDSAEILALPDSLLGGAGPLVSEKLKGS